MKRVIFIHALVVCLLGSTVSYAKKSDWMNQSQLRTFEQELRNNSKAVTGLKCWYDRDSRKATYQVNYRNNRNGRKDWRIISGRSVINQAPKLGAQGFKRASFHSFTGKGNTSIFQCALFVK